MATKTRTLKTPRQKAQFLWDQFSDVAGSCGKIVKKKLHFSGLIVNGGKKKADGMLGNAGKPV